LSVRGSKLLETSDGSQATLGVTSGEVRVSDAPWGSCRWCVVPGYGAGLGWARKAAAAGCEAVRELAFTLRQPLLEELGEKPHPGWVEVVDYPAE